MIIMIVQGIGLNLFVKYDAIIAYSTFQFRYEFRSFASVTITAIYMYIVGSDKLLCMFSFNINGV